MSQNTSVSGIGWIELPGIGRTMSGITPWPRGGDEQNFTVGAGPSVYVSLLNIPQIISSPVSFVKSEIGNMTSSHSILSAARETSPLSPTCPQPGMPTDRIAH